MFVTGTGTGVGKTVVAAAIVAALSAKGRRIAAFKPAVSGIDEPDTDWPADHVLLAASTGWQTPERVTPYVFGPAVSPHFAAELEGTAVQPAIIDGAFARAAAESDAIVCEGVGGLLVPITSDPPLSVLDLVKRYGLPTVVVTQAELGCISDTRLTVDRLRAEAVDVAAVVISPWPDAPSALQLSNRESIERLCDVAVHTLPPTTPGKLAEAAAHLPVEDWVGFAREAGSSSTGS